ncbi:MAG TPA: DnaJ domain-containing protein [Ramlibacter sp.]|nr:DnaJ domain-containing protein [Ramlibacter sp.]
MKSAYLILGIPGNASDDDIELAFAKAKAHFSPERLADAPGAADRFQQVKLAYEILKDKQSRAAHDRKLQAPTAASRTARTTIVAVDDEPAWRRYVPAALWLAAAVFVAGLFVSYQNAEARKAQAAQEQAARELEEKERERQREEATRLAAERVRAKTQAEAEDRRFSMENRVVGAIASANLARQEAQAVAQQRALAAEAQRQQSAMAAEDRRNAAEAQRRLAMDRQRIRELCYAQYRRPDC